MNLETSFSRTIYIKSGDQNATNAFTQCKQEDEAVISIIEDDSDSEPEIEKECPFCQILYENSEHLSQHLLEAHKNKQNQKGNLRILNKEVSKTMSYFADTYYTCEKCPEKFLCRDEYRTHLQTHPREKLHKCPICPNTFLYLNKLKHHLLNHNKLSCDICNKTFRTKKVLEAHSKQHLLFNQKCYLCSDTFQTKKKLQTHIKRYHCYPFNCHKCGRGFKTQRKYKTHMKYPDCPNKCQICQRSYQQKNALRMHMKKVHKTTLEEDQYIIPDRE